MSLVVAVVALLALLVPCAPPTAPQFDVARLVPPNQVAPPDVAGAPLLPPAPIAMLMTAPGVSVMFCDLA